MTTKFKTVRTSLKATDAGDVEVVFATLNVVDHDGDILTKAAFDDGAPVVISAYGHGSHRGELPIGKGRIVMSDTEAKMVGRFFMNTTHGRDAFLTVKELSDEDALQEWSFSLRDVTGATGEDQNGDAGFVIDHVFVKEVSPVLEGAGINTHTVVAKAMKESVAATRTLLTAAGSERWASDDVYVYVEDFDPEASTAVFCIWDDGVERLAQVSFARDGQNVTLSDEETDVQRVTEYVPKSGARFIEQAKSVLAGVTALADRAVEVVARRTEKGKHLSPESAAVVGELDTQLGRLRDAVKAAPTVERALTPLDARITLAQMEDDEE